VATALFFIFSPLTYRSWDEIIHHDLRTYAEARNYYNAISSAYSIFATTAGILLGLYYFVRKNRIDTANRLKERRAKRIEVIHDQLNVYDSIIDEIISLQVKDQEELDRCRRKAKRAFEIINAIIDADGCVLDWTDKEINTIIAIDSYVDKNYILMESSHDELNECSDIEIIRAEYIDRLQEARKVCLEKADSIYA
jgi:hypothetical protein